MRRQQQQQPQKASSRLNSLAAALPSDLPPGWVRVESRSKPGVFYYAHPATGKTQAEKPVDLNSRQRAFAQVIASSSSSKTSARGAGGAPTALPRSTASAGPSLNLERRQSEDQVSGPKPAPKAVDLEDAEVQKRLEARKADMEAKKKEAEEKRKEAEAKARLLREQEDKEQEEARQRAMQRRVSAAVATKAKEPSDSDEEAENKMNEEKERIAQIRRATLQKEGARRKGGKKKAWLEEDDSDESKEVTNEDVEKWRADEERREREEIESKIRAKEEAERKIIEDKLERERLAREEEERKLREAQEEERRIVEEALEQARQIAEYEEAKKKQREEEEKRREEEKAERERLEAEKKEAERLRQEEEEKQMKEERLEKARAHARLIEEQEEKARLERQAEELKKQEEALEKARREEEYKEAIRKTQEMREKAMHTPSGGLGTVEPDAKRQCTEGNWNSGGWNASNDWGSNNWNSSSNSWNANNSWNNQNANSNWGGASSGNTSKYIGTVIWYNGRRRAGVLQCDWDRKRYRIATGGAPNGGLAPPVPGGLMHGTRVNYLLTNGGPGQEQLCYDVTPIDGQVGLSCGGDSQICQRPVNEDRTIAVDLPEGLGHMVGIFDGHRGTNCADYLAKNLSNMMVKKIQEQIQEWARYGRQLPSLTMDEEADCIKVGTENAFEACDQEFLAVAQQNQWGDGASALVALVSHGYEVDPGRSTVQNAPGGQAKLFAACCGTGRMLMLRGRNATRITRDHVCADHEERARLEGLGAMVLQDLRGTWVMGRPDRLDLARQRQQGYEESVGPKPFLAASRGFGDLMIKQLPYRSLLGNVSQTPVLTAKPEVNTIDLTPADWAVVMASRGVFSVLSDQEVADVVIDAMGVHGKGSVDAARAVTQRAMQRGAKDNLTCIILRFGWTQPPAMKTLAELLAANKQ